MDDKGAVVHNGPIYDPLSWPHKCAEIYVNPHDIALKGGMKIGPLNVQPILLYIPDTPYFQERWETVQKHLQERGIENLIQVAGIHGTRFGIDGTHTYDVDNPGSGFKIGPGYTAEFLSVYMMYNIMSVLPATHFLKLECDVDMIPDFLHHLSRELENVPEDFDFLWVGSCCMTGKTNKLINGNVYQFDQSTGYPFGGHCYIVAKKAIPYIIQTQRDAYASSDLNLCFHTFPNLKCYGIFPRLATQKNTDLPL